MRANLLHPKISEFVNFTKESGGIDTSFTTNAFKLSTRFVESSLKNISWIKVSFNGGIVKLMPTFIEQTLRISM